MVVKGAALEGKRFWRALKGIERYVGGRTLPQVVVCRRVPVRAYLQVDS